jgi:hypothetical protein
MKNTTLSLLLVLFISACSHKTPQLAISEADMARPVEVVTNGEDLVSLHRAAKAVLMFSPEGSAKLQKFGKAHLHQKTQIMVGSHVVIEPIFDYVGTNEEFDLSFETREEAQAVADLLNKR